jgi:3-methyladenine DNA glycosylase/8-oxoguanine DNA glycosylase
LAAPAVEVRAEVRPASPFRLPVLTGADGVVRRRGGVLERLVHDGEVAAVVRIAQPRPDSVVFGARSCSRAAAERAVARMRFALGVDEDLRPFVRRFERDELIGASVRRRPWLRVGRRPDPFEALTLAVCEQLIDYERAAAIQRRIIARLGRRAPAWDASARELRDAPTAAALAHAPPALLESFDLSAGRSRALVRAAREVAQGRVDLYRDHERGWRRLLAIPGIGAWTVEMLALRGQGRHDQLPAGDLGLLKLAGRLLSGGDPRAVAREPEVRAMFAPYGEWAGLAAAHAIGL